MGQGTPIKPCKETVRLRAGGRGRWIVEAVPIWGDEPPFCLAFSGSDAYRRATEFFVSVGGVVGDAGWSEADAGFKPPSYSPASPGESRISA